MCTRHMTALLLALFVVSAAADTTQVTRYNLYSKGLRIGSVRTERSRVVTNGQTAVKCDVTTHVDVNLLVYRHRLESREIYVSNGKGPIAYELTRRENGRSRDVQGYREGDRFTFVVTQDGQTQTNTFHDAEYDAVGIEGPDLLLSAPGDEDVLRVLDVSGARIVERTYRWVDSEDDLRIVEFADANKSGRRWVREDDLGMFIARQEGRDEAGTYSMQMVE